MAQSTKRSRRNKSQAEKPYLEFPLTAHSTGRWVKQHKRRMFYFGRLDDWETALEKYKREWPYILQGLTPPSDDDGEWLNVDDLVNTWLDVKRQVVDSRELRLKTWQQYRPRAVAWWTCSADKRASMP